MVYSWCTLHAIKTDALPYINTKQHVAYYTQKHIQTAVCLFACLLLNILINDGYTRQIFYGTVFEMLTNL